MINFWKAKLVKDGPYVPIKTWLGPPLIDGELIDRSPRWQALVRLETTARAILFGDDTPIEIEGMKTLRSLERISEADYQFMVKHADYATKHKPDSPDAQPFTPIDWNKGKPVF